MAGKPVKARGCSLKRKPRLDDYKVFVYETRSLHRWMSHRSESRLHCARSTCRFSAACWSTDSLPLSGDSLFRELLYKSTFLRRCWALPMLETALIGTECHHCGDVSLSSLRSRLAFFSESNPAPRSPPGFFLPGTCEEKAVGQRISAFGDEWAYTGCIPAYLTLSAQRVFTLSLHPPRPASLCGCKQSGLIRWKRWRRDGLQPGGFRYWGAPDAEEPCERLLTRRIK